MLLKHIRKLETKFDRSAERFTFRHPRLAFILMFLGVPAFILAATTLITVCITVPIVWLFG